MVGFFGKGGGIYPAGTGSNRGVKALELFDVD
jgi:hypothetical protein